MTFADRLLLRSMFAVAASIVALGAVGAVTDWRATTFALFLAIAIWPPALLFATLSLVVAQRLRGRSAASGGGEKGPLITLQGWFLIWSIMAIVGYAALLVFIWFADTTWVDELSPTVRLGLWLLRNALLVIVLMYFAWVLKGRLLYPAVPRYFTHSQSLRLAGLQLGITLLAGWDRFRHSAADRVDLSGVDAGYGVQGLEPEPGPVEGLGGGRHVLSPVELRGWGRADLKVCGYDLCGAEGLGLLPRAIVASACESGHRCNSGLPCAVNTV